MSNFSNLRPNPQIPGQPPLPRQGLQTPPVAEATDPLHPPLHPPQLPLHPPQLPQGPTDPNLPSQGFGGNLAPGLGRTGGGPPVAPGGQYQPQPPVRGTFNDVHPDMGGGFPLAGGRPVGPGGQGGSGGLDGSWVGPRSSLFHGRPGAAPPGQMAPPPGVPPGARFDPIGPLGGRPMGGTPPLPRGGAAPLFRGEPDNDLERPPPDDDFGYQQRPDVRAANALMYGVPAVTGGTTGALAGAHLANPAAPGAPQGGVPQPRQAAQGAQPKGFDYGW